MFKLINGVVLIIISMLILIQQDADGIALIDGWIGLYVACITTFTLGVMSIALSRYDLLSRIYHNDIVLLP